MTNVRTIISAVDPVRRHGEYTVQLKVWFQELDEPVIFIANPFDCELHGRELWIRAMAGEYGPVKLVDSTRMLEYGYHR